MSEVFVLYIDVSYSDNEPEFQKPKVVGVFSDLDQAIKAGYSELRRHIKGDYEYERIKAIEALVYTREIDSVGDEDEDESDSIAGSFALKQNVPMERFVREMDGKELFKTFHLDESGNLNFECKVPKSLFKEKIQFIEEN